MSPDSDSGATPPPPSVPMLINQDEIDAAIQMVKEEQKRKAAQPKPAPKPAQPLPTPTVTFSESRDLGLLSQDEIEAAIQTHKTQVKPADAPKGLQDDIDALIRQAASGPVLGIDTTIGQSANAATPEPPLNQSEIDRLLAAADAEPTNFKAAEAALQKIDQAEIDAMMRADGGGASGAPIDATDMLSQEELDKLLASIEPDKQLGGAELDAVITPAGTTEISMDSAIRADSAPITLGQDELEALLASHPMLREEPTPPLPYVVKQQQEEDPLDRAARENAESHVGQENLAAAVPIAEANEQPLAQDLIDSLLAQAAQAAATTAPAPPMRENTPAKDGGVELKASDNIAVELSDDDFADMGITPTHPAPSPGGAEAQESEESESSEESSVIARRLSNRRKPLKLLATLAASMLVGASAFAWLWSNRTQTPRPTVAVETHETLLLEDAIALAKESMGKGEFIAAMKTLGQAMRTAEPGPLLEEARFLHVESGYRSLPPKPSEVDVETVLKNIEDIVSHDSGNPRNVDALMWKAEVYRRTGLPTTARDTYERILSGFPGIPKTDAILLETAKLSFELKYFDDATKSLERIVNEFPQSVHKSEAQMLMAQCYEGTGRVADAEKVYATVMAERTDSRIGADAALALARIANAAGDTQRAIQSLEARLQTATTIEGNDGVYVELAKAFRAIGKPADAVRVARELLSFFPESPRVPEAVVELTEALDASGDRGQALELAKQAAERFEKDPQIAKTRAQLLGKTGDARAAAEALVKADELGAQDPHVVLEASRKYAEIGEAEKAVELMKRVIDSYPNTEPAVDAGIDLARVEYEKGDLAGAIDRLSALSASPTASSRQLPIQQALGDIYHDLGLTKRATAAYEKVATMAQEPDVLARAATVLLESGAVGSALPIIAKLDPNRLSSKAGFDLLMAQGRALLGVEPDRALEKMQQAFEQYPVERTPRDFEFLVRACLDTGKTARARALVSDFDVFVQTHPEERPRLQRTAALWGDALYNAGDYRAAIEAYALAAPRPPEVAIDPATGAPTEDAAAAPEDDTPAPPDSVWAKYQSANALLKLDDFSGSVPIFEELATSDTPYADDARLKAEYARLEQRLRGERPAPAMQKGS